MNGINTILADTNFIIYLLEGRKETLTYLDKFIVVSVITEMELLGVKNISSKVFKARKSLLDDTVIFPFDEEIKDIAVKIKQNYTIKLPDAIIAATSIKYRTPLISADKKKKKIKELD
ncbi:MAG: type II toxin-antitoxin system VapC family toxin, partial [Sphingobacteriales bacterium]|nr:type II toxin-antitoxin system VapC family toxin [Sphingobacteriales bacterium]